MAKTSKPKKAANLARAIWRTRGYCENCGKTNGKLDGAHYFGVGSYIRICSDIRNGFCLCFTCHRKSHDDATFALQIAKKTGAAKHEEALRALAAPSLQKIDWDERIEFLKDVLKQIEAGELTIEEAKKYERS